MDADLENQCSVEQQHESAATRARDRNGRDPVCNDDVEAGGHLKEGHLRRAAAGAAGNRQGVAWVQIKGSNNQSCWSVGAMGFSVLFGPAPSLRGLKARTAAQTS